jgi:catechol 2,3-dioxygenase-like lactoylglutathione lyase family enzyme
VRSGNGPVHSLSKASGPEVADTADMDIQFVASFAVITTDPARDRRLFVDTLGLPLTPPVSVAGSKYLYSEGIPGAKHFGVWPLTEAAEACFGQSTWPDTHPVPQASVEFEVEDVESAASELEEGGYRLIHPVRTEPWGQVIARFQAADGMLLGVCFTPWMHDA